MGGACSGASAGPAPPFARFPDGGALTERPGLRGGLRAWTTSARRILATRTVRNPRPWLILRSACDPGIRQGGEIQLPNPLAIGVTLGGLLLEVVAPRPKPRAGCAHELSLLSERAVSRTPRS